MKAPALLIFLAVSLPCSAASWKVGNTLIGYDAAYLFGNTNSPFSTLINFYPPTVNSSAGLRWYDPLDPSHYYDISQDVFSRRDWLCFHDSRIGQDTLKWGLGGSPYAGNFEFGVGDLDPSIQVRVYDVGKPNIQWSVLALSQNDGFRADSVSRFSDAYTLKRGFAEGGNWLHFLRGNETTSWRVGHGLDSQGCGDDLVFYNPNRDYAGTKSNPGHEALRVTSGGMLAIPTGLLIRSNAAASIPALSAGAVYFWASNGVAYMICSDPSGLLTTNKLGP